MQKRKNTISNNPGLWKTLSFREECTILRTVENKPDISIEDLWNNLEVTGVKLNEISNG